MNRLKPFIWLCLALALWLPKTVHAAGDQDDRVVVGGSYVLASGDELDGNLTVIGGTAEIETDATVNGDVIIMGGQVNVDGTIEGNLSVFGGSGNLGANAVVTGNIAMYSSALNQDENAVVEGEITHEDELPNGFIVPDRLKATETIVPDATANNDDHPLLDMITTALWIIFASIATAIVAMIVTLFFPRAMNITAEAVVKNPLLAGGVGLLTVIAAPIAIALSAITLVLIPVGAVAALALAGAVIFGWIVLGLELGNRIQNAFKVSWHPAIAAGLGNLILTFVLLSLGQFPCFGWALDTTVAIFGLGGVILTRFGTRLFIHEPAIDDNIPN